MSKYVMSDGVARFLTSFIGSVAELELLLLLRTSLPRCWTVAQLVEELRVDADWAVRQIDRFCTSGLAASDGQQPPAYCFRAMTPHLDEAVTAVAQDYLVHRVSIIEFIYSRPSDTLRVFAEAFRLRKEPPHG
jgi:hypothetical protein